MTRPDPFDAALTSLRKELNDREKQCRTSALRAVEYGLGQDDVDVLAGDLRRIQILRLTLDMLVSSNLGSLAKSRLRDLIETPATIPTRVLSAEQLEELGRRHAYVFDSLKLVLGDDWIGYVVQGDPATGTPIWTLMLRDTALNSVVATLISIQWDLPGAISVERRPDSLFA